MKKEEEADVCTEAVTSQFLNEGCKWRRRFSNWFGGKRDFISL